MKAGHAPVISAPMSGYVKGQSSDYYSASKSGDHTEKIKSPDISIVVPAYNEAKVLPGFWARLGPVIEDMEKAGFSSEVVFVNDGSTDDTVAVMKSLAGRIVRVKVIDLARRFGHQAALAAGMDHAEGRAVAVLDADLQDPPELLAEFLQYWRDGKEVVYGLRRHRHGDSLFKRATANLFYRMLSWIAGEGVRPDVGDFYLMDRKVVDALHETRTVRPFLRGALSQAGFRHAGVSYDRSERWAGKTKYSLVRMVNLAFDAVSAMTFRPLRLSFITGILFIISGIIAVIPFGFDVRVFLVFFSGVQLVSIGLLGEYVGRTHAIVSGRPLYLVRDIQEFISDDNEDGDGITVMKRQISTCKIRCRAGIIREVEDEN